MFGISDQSRNRVGLVIERVVASARAVEETTIARRAGTICRNEQMNFVDAALADCGGMRMAALLASLDAATPWKALAAPIRNLPEYRKRGADHPP